MKSNIIHISEALHSENKLRTVISFGKFVEFLRDNIREPDSLKAPYFRWILKKFEKLPELLGSVEIENTGLYEEMLELVSSCLLPLAADQQTLWAMAGPLSPDIFYGTDGIYDLLKSLSHGSSLKSFLDDEQVETEKIMQELQYGLVLEKLYNLPILKKTEWVRKFEDRKTGLDKYFLLNIDTRFIDVKPIGALPALDCSAMNPSSIWGEEFKRIQKIIPLHQFEASGFSVVTLNDITDREAAEHIGKLIINHTGDDMTPLFKEINHSLQTITGSKHFQFGIVPFLSINERPALVYANFPYSIIIQACWQSGVPKHDFNALRKVYAQNPRIMMWSENDSKKDFPDMITQAFRENGILSYMMFPIFHNRKLTGVFEISTKQEHPMMSEGQLLRLKPALPMITQLVQNLIARFHASIEVIIKEKFTSIQPAVQWKFNEAAWHYLRDHAEDNMYPIENIEFRGLYPLYGAVDIRNSTILRNEALAKDYNIQLNLLIDTVTALDNTANPQLERILASSHDWLQIVHEALTTQQEIRLTEFFNLDVHYELENLIHTWPGTEGIIRPYFQAVSEEDGKAFENRRLLESDIQLLNESMNTYYETASGELQEIYPCYFEKFRTDGLEYDIYVGQSIAPKKPFLKENLQQMKKWQLKSMVEVVRLMHSLKQSMVHPLQTTQLLFVHPQTIDITFRKDERRFDVEGAYNIRYHIIKKRIDKVNILDSDERLTQPGKIALVYFDERNAREYMDYIREFQEQDFLADDLEELELEALQGVKGLKALRVGVLV